MNSSQSPSPPHPPAQLGLWDAVSIIIGIVVGTGIYETPPLFFKNVSGPWAGLGLWALAGLLSFIGALCYAELATTYRRSGGDYVYLSRAYGSWAGFIFGWAQLAVVLTGSIGMMAYVFADYGARLWGLDARAKFGLAVAPLIVLSLLNLLGVVFGKRTQNVLSVAKIVGLAGIIVAGFGWGGGWTAESSSDAIATSNIPFAMVLVLLTYGGWNDAAYVAAEVRDGNRNVPRALLLGIAIITVLYLLVNGAYLYGLGFAGARGANAIAASVLALPLGSFGEKAMCLVVMTSALGTINGLIFSGSRVYATLGTDHPLFAWLGRWQTRSGAPAGAILIPAVIGVGMMAVVGTATGREMVDNLLVRLGVEAPAWEGHGGFETLLKCTAPVFWVFFLATGLSLFVLRFKDRGRERPFSVPLFPLVPLIFCCTCAYMIKSGIDYAGKFALIGGGLLVVGLPLYWLSRRMAAAQAANGRPPLEPAPESA
jgi:amino acid transporter